MKKTFFLFCLCCMLLVGCLPSPVSTIPSKAETTPIPTDFPGTAGPMDVSKTAPPETATVPGIVSGSVQFPEWIKSPGESGIFMVNGCPSKENCHLLLVNPDRGASYNLPMNDIAVYFWLPAGEGIGLITNHQQFINIDFSTGEVTQADLPAQSLRYFPDALPSEYLRAAYAFGDTRSGEWFVVPNLREFSSDRKHRVLQDLSNEESPISIEYLESGEVIRVAPGNDGIYEVEYAWSPVSNELAVLLSSSPAFPSLGGQVVYGDTRLIVFDASQKTITRDFEGDYASISWSPDGRYILYQVPLADDLGYSPEACVLDVQIDRRRCLGTIANQTTGAYNIDYGWLPDGSGLVYLKQANSEEYNHLCIYRFGADRVDCPSQDVAQISNRKIIQYSLSPDGRFVFLTSDAPYSSFDAPDMPTSAWMQTDGQMFSELWGEADYLAYGWNPVAAGALWKPAEQSTGSPAGGLPEASQPVINPGWQLYLNRSHSFTLEFPPGWLVLETPTLVYPTAHEGIWFDHMGYPPPQTGARPDVSLYILETDPTQDWRAEYFNDFESSEIQIGGIPAVRISGINKETLAREDAIIVPLDTFYILAYTNQSPQAEQYFDQILATLRFVQSSRLPAQELALSVESCANASGPLPQIPTPPALSSGLDLSGDLSKSLGGGVVQSNGFTIELWLYCDRYFGPFSMEPYFISDIDHLAVFINWRYDGAVEDAPVYIIQGIEPDLRGYALDHQEKGLNSGYGISRGLFKPFPDFSSKGTLRFVYLALFPSGEFSGAALSFDLQQVSDGLQPSQIFVAPLSEKDRVLEKY